MSKASDEDASAKSGTGRIDPKGRDMVMRMTEHAFQVLNVEMDDFFESKVDLFDQDVDELSSGRGETLEQYSAFNEYLKELELHFDEFATKEGFRSSKDAFEFIQDAVSVDAAAQQALMAQLRSHLEAVQAQWAGASAAAASSSSPVDAVEGRPRVAWVSGAPDATTVPPQAEAKKDGGGNAGSGGQPSAHSKEEFGARSAPASETGGSPAVAEAKEATGSSSSDGRHHPAKSAAGSGEEPEFSGLVVGSEVEVFAIQARPELNGRVGVVVGLPSPSPSPSASTGGGSADRFSVVLRSAVTASPGEEWGDQFLFKGKNLRPCGPYEPDPTLAEEALAAVEARKREREEQRLLARQQQQERQGVAAASGVGGGSVELADKETAPLILFCQPIPLQNLVDSVLGLAEYQTFSLMMRMKVRQRKMVSELEAKSQELEADVAQRRRQLDDLLHLCSSSSSSGGGCGGEEGEGRGEGSVATALFESLRERLTGLTPHRPDRAAVTADKLQDRVWALLASRAFGSANPVEGKATGDEEEGGDKEAVTGLATFVFETLEELCSPSEVAVVNEDCGAVDALLNEAFSSTGGEAVARRAFAKAVHALLSKAHQHVDTMRRQMFEVFRLQHQAMQEMKKAHALQGGRHSQTPALKQHSAMAKEEK